MPSLGCLEAVMLTITTVSPQRTKQEPFASCAILPVSTTKGLPAKVVSHVLNMMISPFLRGRDSHGFST